MKEINKFDFQKRPFNTKGIILLVILFIYAFIAGITVLTHPYAFVKAGYSDVFSDFFKGEANIELIKEYMFAFMVCLFEFLTLACWLIFLLLKKNVRFFKISQLVTAIYLLLTLMNYISDFKLINIFQRGVIYYITFVLGIVIFFLLIFINKSQNIRRAFTTSSLLFYLIRFVFEITKFAKYAEYSFIRPLLNFNIKIFFYNLANYCDYILSFISVIFVILLIYDFEMFFKKGALSKDIADKRNLTQTEENK